MNQPKNNTQPAKPGSTTNYPDDQEGPVLEWLIPAAVRYLKRAKIYGYRFFNIEELDHDGF